MSGKFLLWNFHLCSWKSVIPEDEDVEHREVERKSQNELHSQQAGEDLVSGCIRCIAGVIWWSSNIRHFDESQTESFLFTLPWSVTADFPLFPLKQQIQQFLSRILAVIEKSRQSFAIHDKRSQGNRDNKQTKEIRSSAERRRKHSVCVFSLQARLQLIPQRGRTNISSGGVVKENASTNWEASKRLSLRRKMKQKLALVLRNPTV